MKPCLNIHLLHTTSILEQKIHHIPRDIDILERRRGSHKMIKDAPTDNCSAYCGSELHVNRWRDTLMVTSILSTDSAFIKTKVFSAGDPICMKGNLIFSFRFGVSSSASHFFSYTWRHLVCITISFCNLMVLFQSFLHPMLSWKLECWKLSSSVLNK